MRVHQVSSSAEYKATHSSSVKVLRHCRKASAPDPTGWRTCQLPLSATSRIFFATSEGGTGFFCSVASKIAAIRAYCGYDEEPGATSRRCAIPVSVMPGSTTATRTLNIFISPASPSLSASNAHLLAIYGVRGELLMRPATELTLMMHPLRRCRMYGTTD